MAKQASSHEITRCHWAKTEPNLHYHDHEWGVPIHDDRRLFEFLILEGAQAGLSWETILKKREAYRLAFDQFDPNTIVKYNAKKQESLMANPGIVRNRLKIASVIQNAKCFLEVQSEYGSFDAFLWDFVGGRPKTNAWQTMADVPAKTVESDAMSQSLKKRGFKFIGSTICYAFMQATGMVNDHLVGCFRYAEIVKRRP